MRLNRATPFLALVLMGFATHSVQSHATPLTYAQAYGSALATPAVDPTSPWNDVFKSGSQSASTNVAPKTGTSSFGTASANMVDGTLHVSSYVDTSDPNITSAQVFASARLMDRFIFSTQNGNPYAFQSSDSVTFHIDVDGISYFEEVNAAFGGNTAIQLRFAWWGTGKSIGNTSEFANIRDYTSLCSIQTNEHDTSTSQGGAGGPVCGGVFSIRNSQNGVPFSFSDGFDFTFNPMGDFDWAIELTAMSSAGDYSDGTPFKAYMDASHTATLSFIGPDGAIVSAASGLFPFSRTGNTVPEPLTLPLIGAALAGFAALRRNYRHETTQPA